MPNARSFVIMYSVVLMVLFISFLYLMTTIDPHITPPTYVSSTVPTITTKKTITTTVTTTTVGDNEDDKKNFKARGGIHPNVSTYKFKHPANIKGHRRKENIIERIMQTVRSQYRKYRLFQKKGSQPKYSINFFWTQTRHQMTSTMFYFP